MASKTILKLDDDDFAPKKGHRFQPGDAWRGNRSGRPKKGLALADILAVAGTQPVITVHGEPTRHQWVAERIWEALMQGKVTLDDRVLKVKTFKEWFAVLQWVVDRIDRPPGR